MFVSKSIMMVGSSMTQRAYDPKYMGFGIGLSSWYSRLADIFLRGQSGYNSRWTLATLPDLIGSHKPDMAVIFLGNNDSINNGNGQSVPVEEYRSNMIAIMNGFRTVNPDIILLLLTPTRATKIGRIDSVTAKYTEVIRELGEQDDRSAIVELWDGENAILSCDLCDGLHLNIEGNQKVLNEIKATINLKFKEIVPCYDETTLRSRNSEKSDTTNSNTDSLDLDVDMISVESIVADAKPLLRWRFPAWDQLAGTSIEESNELIRLARLRSFL